MFLSYQNHFIDICCKAWLLKYHKQSPEHCVKSVQIRSILWSVFSRIRTEYGEILRIQSNTRSNTPYLNTFHAVEVFYKKAALKNCARFTGKHLCWSLSLIKLRLQFEYCEIFKNTYFEEHLRMAPSEVFIK